MIKYGKPIIRAEEFVSQSVFKDEKFRISYRGDNITPDHKFELLLTSDVAGSKRFNIAPVSHTNLETNLPLDMALGTI